jgi:uncharacterized phage protein (TIGR01671 family)
MRDYEFRGLNGDKTEWIYANLYNVSQRFTHNGVWKDTVGQYTGLMDKNGDVDVYEGDILQMPYTSDKTSYGVVKREKNTCNLYIEWNFKRKYEGKEYWDKNDLTLNKISEMVVIGNVADNPELLKEV